jgi:hypothetical protein
MGDDGHSDRFGAGVSACDDAVCGGGVDAERRRSGASAEVEFWLGEDLQGLKPKLFAGIIGTTEVVPCYRAALRRGFLIDELEGELNLAGVSGGL